MTVVGEGRTVTREHVEKLSKSHGISLKRASSVIGDVRAARSEWPTHARDAGVGVSITMVSQGLPSVAQEFGRWKLRAPGFDDGPK